MCTSQDQAVPLSFFLQVVRAVTQAGSVAGSVVGVSLTWVRYHVHTDAASCLIIVVLGPMCARTIKLYRPQSMVLMYGRCVRLCLWPRYC